MGNKNNKSRVAILREMLGLSQVIFAEKVGITQGALSQLETGKSALSLSTLEKISKSCQANCNWLVHGKGDIFMNDTVQQASSDKNESQILLEQSTLIPLILEEARAGYIKGHKDTEYINTLDVYKIPGFENGSYRLFEIQGDSMIPTIYPREIVVSEEMDDWKAVENGTLCVVITDNDLVAKRVYLYDEDDDHVILKSDNVKYKTYSVNYADIHEMWIIRAKITNVFSSVENNAASQLRSLTADVEELKEQIRNLAKREN